METPYIYWEIVKNEVGRKIVKFWLEDKVGTILVHTEELENIIGDYVEQREDEWVEKGE